MQTHFTLDHKYDDVIVNSMDDNGCISVEACNLQEKKLPSLKLINFKTLEVARVHLHNT